MAKDKFSDPTIEPAAAEEVIAPAQPEVAPLPAAAPSSFITIIPRKPAPAPAAAEEKTAAKRPENNVRLEVPEEAIEQIKPGAILQANFGGIELRIKYHVQPGDNPESALAVLREAIFCAHGGYPLPKHVHIHSVYGRQASTALANHVGGDGSIDATIEITAAPSGE